MLSKIGFHQFNQANKNLNFGELTITKGRHNHQKLHELEFDKDKFEVKRGNTRIKVNGTPEDEAKLQKKLTKDGFKAVNNVYVDMFK